MTLRVLHLVGSAVNEFLADLSQLYARDCLTVTADAARYEFHVAYVSPDRTWRFPGALTPAATEAATPLDLAGAMRYLAGLNLDVVVPQMFCLPGMTSYRALFDVLGVPYVGNSAEVMALGADKAKARAVVAAAGVPVPPADVLRRGQRPTLKLPVVVKPVDSDNSLGISLVRDAGSLDAALDDAFGHSDRVLVESYVELGREVRCGIIARDGELIGLPLEEYDVDSASKPIRTRADKIGRTGEGDLTLVAKTSDRAWSVPADDLINERVWDLAKRAHLALGCRHYSLFDFRIDPKGQPWFLEAGLYCSFARQSVIAMMADAAGIGLSELFEAMIAEAVR